MKVSRLSKPNDLRPSSMERMYTCLRSLASFRNSDPHLGASRPFRWSRIGCLENQPMPWTFGLSQSRLKIDKIVAIYYPQSLNTLSEYGLR